MSVKILMEGVAYSFESFSSLAFASMRSRRVTALAESALLIVSKRRMAFFVVLHRFCALSKAWVISLA